ncbi:MAG: tripartite tricarboxylate transporter TctB family protein [Candidatus Rokubacteria bacterium]|nr:tripartite tricarboxylate transporter TctB family protein [Candidatus Rokubacteria bacterium]
MIRHPRDFWSGLIFIAAGGAAVAIARNYPMGSAVRMGPAYFPTVLGALLALIGIAILVRSFITPGERIAGFAWKPLVLVLVSTVLFGVLVRTGGLVVALILLVLISAWASRNFRWAPAVALAVGLTVFSVLVFVKALGLPIPVIGAWLGG